ncbi:MAG: IPExxxVDY family protein [Bacteroidota bacterium]
MATYSLDIHAEEHFDFDLFSITCNESIYRVIHELNNDLDIDLQLNELLDYTHKEGEDFYFPVYSFQHVELNIEFNLLQNQSSFQPTVKKKQATDLFAGEVEQTTRLMPELDKTDYLLLIKGDNRYLYNHTILETIQQNNSFIAVHELFIEDIKDKRSRTNLLF